jgi:hypothetical protein
MTADKQKVEDLRVRLSEYNARSNVVPITIKIYAAEEPTERNGWRRGHVSSYQLYCEDAGCLNAEEISELIDLFEPMALGGDVWMVSSLRKHYVKTE